MFLCAGNLMLTATLKVIELCKNVGVIVTDNDLIWKQTLAQARCKVQERFLRLEAPKAETSSGLAKCGS